MALRGKWSGFAMKAGLITGLAFAVALAPLVVIPAALAQQKPVDLAPYMMLRSLQFVQDSVVLGDHSAGEMQSFMIDTIDKRLRTANRAVFDDPRNVDAALIYAMSGGNPQTLEYLASRDLSGNFDSRVADDLRKYLNGKGVLVAKSLGEMAVEYRDEKIGPYLSLVHGNVAVAQDPEAALVSYDWARLTAPGTIVEEAALRRSVAITVEADMVDKALAYSRKYARRFVHSPYASQFADLFVDLVVEHFGRITERNIDDTVELMDADRRREVFLRIARAAAISGKNDLARLASAKAEALKGDAAPAALAKLYGSVADIPTSDIHAAMKAIAAMPEAALSPRDQALRQAAEIVANQVLTRPNPESLAQDQPARMTTADEMPPAVAAENIKAGPMTDGPVTGDPTAATGPDQSFQTFVDSGRSKLKAVDAMLKEESSSK